MNENLGDLEGAVEVSRAKIKQLEDLLTNSTTKVQCEIFTCLLVKSFIHKYILDNVYIVFQLWVHFCAVWTIFSSVVSALTCSVHLPIQWMIKG
jgi:hypothetical protein